MAKSENTYSPGLNHQDTIVSLFLAGPVAGQPRYFQIDWKYKQQLSCSLCFTAPLKLLSSTSDLTLFAAATITDFKNKRETGFNRTKSSLALM